MSILVTGGAGFIGSHLCERLLKYGNEVICVDNLDPYYSPRIKYNNIVGFFKNSNFGFYQIDITRSEDLREVFETHEIDKIAHLAAQVGVRNSMENPQKYVDVNIGGTLNLLRLAMEFEVKNFIFASSSSVYGNNQKIPFSEEDPTDNMISPYAITKRSAEMFCQGYSEMFPMNVSCLRLFTVYGPRGRPDMAPYKFIHGIDKGEEIEVYGDGTSRRDYTYVDNIVDGILLCMDKGPKFDIFNLGSSNPVELNHFISLIEGYLHKKAKKISKPVQPGDVPVTFASIEKSKRVLGWEPKISLEEGIKRTIEYLKSK